MSNSVHSLSMNLSQCTFQLNLFAISDLNISISSHPVPGYKFALVTAAGLIGFLAFLGVVRCLRSGVITTATGRSGSSSSNNNGSGGGSSSSNNNGNSGNNVSGSGGGRGIRSAGLALSGSLLSEDRTPLNAASPYSVPVSILENTIDE